MRILHPGPAAVMQLQRGDVVAVLVGEEARVTVAMLVEDRELRAGVWTLAAGDQPGALGPGEQVEIVGQLRDHAPLRSLPSASIACTHADSGSSRIARRTVSVSS